MKRIFLILNLWIWVASVYAQPSEPLLLKADSCIAARKYSAAIDLLSQILEQKQGELGPNSYEFQRLVFKKAQCFFKIGQFENAIPLFETCKAILIETTGVKTEEYANLLVHLGACKRQTDDFHGAVPVYQELIQTYEQQGKGDSELAFKARLGLTQSQLALGDLENSEQHILQNMEEMRELHLENNRTYGGFALNLGNLYLDQGRYTKAQAAYEQCRAVHHKIGATDSLACIGSLGLVLESKSNYIEAADIYDRVLSTLRENNLQERFSDYYSITLENLSGAYYALGLTEKAKALMEEKLAFLEKQLGTDSDLYGLAQKSYGLILLGEDNAAAALPLLQRGVEISRKNYGENNENITKDVLVLARCYLKFNRILEAETLLEGELAKITAQPNLSNYYKPGVLSTLSDIHIQKKSLDEARVYLEESLQIRRKNEDFGHEYASACLRLALLSENQGNPAASVAYIKEATQIYSRILHEGATVFSDRESIDFYIKFKNGNDKALSFAFRHPDIIHIIDLLQNEINNKSILFRSTVSLQNWFANTPDTAARNAYDTWLDQREKLNFAYTQRPADAAKIQQLEESTDRMKRELAKISGRFARYAGSELDRWQDMAALLQPGQAAVVISKFNNSSGAEEDGPTIAYAAFVLKPGMETPQLIFFPDGNDLESIYIGMYSLEMHRQGDGAHLSDIYNAFWKPLEGALQDTRVVFLVADGIYHKINPSTLQRPDGTWLQDVYDIHILDELSDLKSALFPEKNTIPKEKTAFLLGNPAFSASIKSKEGSTDIASRTIEQLGLNALPESEKEVFSIKNLLVENGWKVEMAIGEEATKEKVKSVMKPTVLHLATHGYFLENAQKALRLFGWEEKYVGQNPMLLSLLFFAGAQNGGSEGILTAFEAQNINLSETELAILSACNTGAGKIINGEGVFGLRQALKIAGAKTVIMSLWAVDDRVTQILMTDFYKEWLGGMSKMAAFKHAQNAVREKYPHPNFWGAFILVGQN